MQKYNNLIKYVFHDELKSDRSKIIDLYCDLSQDPSTRGWAAYCIALVYCNNLKEDNLEDWNRIKRWLIHSIHLYEQGPCECPVVVWKSLLLAMDHLHPIEYAGIYADWKEKQKVLALVNTIDREILIPIEPGELINLEY